MDKYLYLLLIVACVACTPTLEDNKRLLIKGNISSAQEFDDITEIEVFLLNSFPSVDQDLNIEFQTNRPNGEKTLGNSRLNSNGAFSFFSLVQDGGNYQIVFTQNGKLLKTGTINRTEYLLDLEEELVDVEVVPLGEVDLNFNASTAYSMPVRVTITFSGPSCNTNYDGSSFIGNSVLDFCSVRSLEIDPGSSEEIRVFASTGSTISVTYIDENDIEQTLQFDVNAPNQTYDSQI